MPSVEYDLRYLRAGVATLEEYLLSNDVFWNLGANPPSGEPAYPQLTLGGILLSQMRAHSKRLTPDQSAELVKIDGQIGTARDRWRQAWGKKAAAEFHARVALWRNFIEDYRENPKSNADRYAYEVSRRVQLFLLQADAQDIPSTEVELLSGLDRFLQSVFLSGDFIWDKEMENSFPRSTFWYLYGNLKK
ncbi:MAG TPA: hypothetical protein VF823_01230 [Anaerolineales bacterium]